MDVDDPLEGELDRLWWGLQDELAQAGSRPRRSRRRLVVVALAAGSLAVGGGAAATIGGHAHTGEYASGWQVDAGGPGETIDMDAPDYPAVVRELAADIPFAPGYGKYRRYTLTVYVAPHPGSGPEAISDSALRGEIADQAICSWADAWVAADRHGDDAARARATRALVGALHWDAVTRLDPHPSMTGRRTDLGTLGTTRFGYLPGAAQAATDGDRRRLIEAVAPLSAGTACVPEQLKAITWPGHR